MAATKRVNIVWACFATNTVFQRLVFSPVGSRVHRGCLVRQNSDVPPLVFGVATQSAKLEATVRDWDAMISNQAWAPTGPPTLPMEPSRPCTVLAWNCTKKTWSAYSPGPIVDKRPQTIQDAVGRLLTFVQHTFAEDPTLEPCTTASLHAIASKRLGVQLPAFHTPPADDALYQYAAMAACNAEATAMHSMAPCITKTLEQAVAQPALTNLKGVLEGTGIRRIVFLPVKWHPLPACAPGGTVFAPGVYARITDLVDAVAASAIAAESDTLLLPSDTSDLPNVPIVSGFDVVTGQSFAYGDVALLLCSDGKLETEFEFKSKLKGKPIPKFNQQPTTSFGNRAVQGIIERLQGHARDLQVAARAVLKEWRAYPPDVMASAVWKAAGCGGTSTSASPFPLDPYSTIDLLEDATPNPTVFPSPPQAKGTRVNLAFMRAHVCTRLTTLLSPRLIGRVKSVVAIALAGGLFEHPWSFAMFQTASDIGDGYGTFQLLSHILRSPNNTAAFYALDGRAEATRILKKSRKPAGGDGESATTLEPLEPLTSSVSVTPSRAACPVDKTEDAKVQAAGPGKFVYDPDAWNLPLAELVAHAEDVPPSTPLKLPLYHAPIINSAVWFHFAAGTDGTETQPYVVVRNTSVAGTTFSQLPSPVRVHSPAMSAFFAGTRFQDFTPTYVEVRGLMGKIIGACASTPTAMDILTLLRGAPVFCSQRLSATYKALSDTQRLRAAMDSLSLRLTAIRAGLKAKQTGEDGEPSVGGITAKDYAEFANMPPREIMEKLGMPIPHIF